MKDLPDNILLLMARQCHLNKSNFLDLIDCHLCRGDYETKLGKMVILVEIDAFLYDR